MKIISLIILLSVTTPFLSAKTDFFLQQSGDTYVKVQKIPLINLEKPIYLPAVKFSNGTVIPAKTFALSFLENMVDKIKSQILANPKLSAKSRLFIENTYVMIMNLNYNMPLCAGVHLNHGFIRIASSLLSILDFRNQVHINCLKMCLYHEFCHICFDDTAFLNNINQKIQSMPCCEVPQHTQVTAQENGFELDPETTEKKTFASLLSIHNNSIFKNNERRADVFAAQFVGANDFAIALKTLHSILEVYYSVNKNIIGNLEQDNHDTLAQRIALLDLCQSGSVSLNLETGNVELNSDKKVLSPVELKTMIEDREKILLTDPFTVIKKTHTPHKKYYITEGHVELAMGAIFCGFIGVLIYSKVIKAD